MTGAAPIAFQAAATAIDVAPVPVAPARRVQFVDASRAVAVLGMLAANLVNVWLRDVPDVLAHNQGDALRAFDFPAPVFQFLVGVSLALFLPAGGRPGRRTEAVRRFVTLILLGMMLDGIGALSPWPRWGVLQTLGLGGLAATALVGASTRVIVGLSLVGLACFSGLANGIVHESPDAALAFVPLTLAGYLLGQRIAAGAAPATIARDASVLAVVAGLGGVGLYVAGVPFNKLTGTSSFIALTTGASALLVAATARFESAGGRFPAWLLVIGRNALTTWVLLHVLVYYPAWLVFPTWQRLALPQGIVAACMTLVALCQTTIVLGRRGIRVAL
jgi:uncharacterized membrane protein YeiB